MNRSTDELKRKYIREFVVLFIRTLELGQEDKIIPRHMENVPHPLYQSILLNRTFHYLPTDATARQAAIHKWLQAKRGMDENNRAIFRAIRHDAERALAGIHEYKHVDEWFRTMGWLCKCLQDMTYEGERHRINQIIHAVIMKRLGPVEEDVSVDETLIGVAI